MSKKAPFALLQFFFAVIYHTFAENSCSIPQAAPIQIPIRNVTQSDQSLTRGIALSVGSPPQNLSFVATAGNSRIYIGDSSVSCSNQSRAISRAGCVSYSGGLFDNYSSSTWLQDAIFKHEHDSNQSHNTSGTDTLWVNSTMALQQFPLVPKYFDPSERIRNVIGLGRNSTFLSALSSTGNISSNTWSFFNGWVGAKLQYQTDGSLVLGGYDAAKISGDNISLPFVPISSCPGGLEITITDIKMNLRNGSSPSIIGPSSGAALKACLLPEKTGISLPYDIWTEFKKISNVTEIGNSLGINLWTELISREGAYDGDLTFILASVLEIRIPNHQLVLPDYAFNATGQAVIHNNGSSNILVTSLQGVNLEDMPHLGQLFFTSAYLLVDNDLGVFTVGKSKMTALQDLVAIRPKPCKISPSIVGSSVLMSSTSTLLGPPTSSASAFSGSSKTSRTMSTGAIGGIVTSAAFVGFFIFVTIFLLRKWRARQRARLSSEHSAKIGPSASNSDHFHGKPELPSDRQPPQEMPLVRDPHFVLAPYELANVQDQPHESPIVRGRSHVRSPYEMPTMETDF